MTIDLIGRNIKTSAERTFFRNGNFATIKINDIEINLDILTAEDLAQQMEHALFDESEWTQTLQNKVCELENRIEELESRVYELEEIIRYKQTA